VWPEAEIDVMKANTAKAWAECARLRRESPVIPFLAGMVLMAVATGLAVLVLSALG